MPRLFYCASVVFFLVGFLCSLIWCKLSLVYYARLQISFSLLLSMKLAPFSLGLSTSDPVFASMSSKYSSRLFLIAQVSHCSYEGKCLNHKERVICTTRTKSYSAISLHRFPFWLWSRKTASSSSLPHAALSLPGCSTLVYLFFNF